MRKLILSLLLFVVIGVSPIYAFQSFPVGMYFVGEDIEDLEMLADGGVTRLFASVDINDSTHDGPDSTTVMEYYKNLIKNAAIVSDNYSIDVHIYVHARFKFTSEWADTIDYNDPNEGFNRLKNRISTLLAIQDTLVQEKRIKGWFISDEPFGKDVSVAELEEYSDRLTDFLGNENYPYDKMVITEGSSIWNVLDPNPNDLFVRQDYSLYKDAFDEIHINYYFSDINIESTDLYNYESFDYDNNWPNGWYTGKDNPSDDEGSLRALSLIWQKVSFDGLVSDPAKQVYLMLPLGKTSKMHGKISHEKTHSGIRKVRDLGFDGVSFYVWKREDHPTYENVAYGNWTDPQYNYVEAVYNEARDKDWLVTAMTNASGNQNKTYLSDRGNGQSPGAGYNEEHNTVINHLATGDLWGEETNDFTFIINNTDERKSIADGDDELVYTTSDDDFWISEEAHVTSDFGDLLNSNQSAASNEEIIAMTTGDFDGDGDSEVITVVEKIYSHPYSIYTTIYSSEEGNNFKQNSLETLPTGVTVTALAAGDFDGSGRDKLIVATYNNSQSNLYIYLSDIAVGDTPTATTVTSNTNASNYVSHFAAGDFNGDFLDELATAFRNSSGSYSHLTISRPKPGGASGNPGWGYNRVWQSEENYERITALAAGDFDNDRKDDLITALWNSSSDESKIYQSSPSFDPCNNSVYSCGGSGDPTNGNEIHSSTYWHVSAMTAGSFRESLPSGASKIIAQNPESDNELVTEYALEQNYPNPFNPVTTINYSIPESQQVKLQVFDVLGRLVSTLVNERKQAGSHTVNFNASSMSSGVYIYKIEAGTFTQTKKFTLIK